MSWEPCKGTVLQVAVDKEAADQVDDPFLGHKVYRLGALHFCRRCGYYAQHRSTNLGRPCKGRPAKNYGPRLELLLAGRHPRSGHPMEVPMVPVTAADAAKWRAQTDVAVRRRGVR